MCHPLVTHAEALIALTWRHHVPSISAAHSRFRRSYNVLGMTVVLSIKFIYTINLTFITTKTASALKKIILLCHIRCWRWGGTVLLCRGLLILDPARVLPVHLKPDEAPLNTQQAALGGEAGQRKIPFCAAPERLTCVPGTHVIVLSILSQRHLHHGRSRSNCNGRTQNTVIHLEGLLDAHKPFILETCSTCLTLQMK